MEITNLSVQDWCAIIGTIITVGGVIVGIFKVINYLYNKYRIIPANIRANFFKQGQSWRLRIYNASETEIEAKNIKVSIPDTEGVHINWDCKKDICPTLKRHSRLDIRVLLCTSAPEFIPITICWEQGKKTFSTTEDIQLRC